MKGSAEGAARKVRKATKSKGRVEAGEGDGSGWGGVEGWGEKADNCN